MLSRTGVLVVGVTSVARGSEGESERERESLCVLPVSSAPRVLDVQRCQCCNVCLRHVLGRPWTSPFIDTRRCPAVQGGVAMCYRGWRRSALSPVHELMWPLEKCLEPCRSTAVGAAWILLTLYCFRRGFRATDVIGACEEPSLPVTGVNLDGTPVLFLHSLRQLARSRVMMYPL
jgi:hypothetical protein